MEMVSHTLYDHERMPITVRGTRSGIVSISLNGPDGIDLHMHFDDAEKIAKAMLNAVEACRKAVRIG
jgi:hypothetical protein